jgi:hypothetical protein
MLTAKRELETPRPLTCYDNIREEEGVERKVDQTSEVTGRALRRRGGCEGRGYERFKGWKMVEGGRGAIACRRLKNFNKTTRQQAARDQ